MIPAIGGAMIGYGAATGRKGLVVAGVAVVLGSIALTVMAYSQMHQGGAK